MPYKTATARNAYMRQYQKRKPGTAALRRAAGLCPDCGGIPAAGRKLCAKCRERYNTKRKARVAASAMAGLCTTCLARPVPTGRRKCEHCRAATNAIRKSLKDAAFARYGGYVCGACGETRQECLQIDHINNDGAKHRRELGNEDSKTLYRWLRTNNYPEGFQILCANCNLVKAVHGYVVPRST